MQRTIREKFEFSGIALHTGQEVSVVVHPSAENTGISFLRTDKPGSAPIQAHASNVVDTSYATTLGKGGLTISTVEHLMAAFYGMGVDNALVEISGSEVPILDGSAIGFAEMIESVGLARQAQARKYLVIKKAISVSDGNRSLELRPSDDFNFNIDYSIDFNHPTITEQSFSISVSPDGFFKEIAKARTFGFLSDVDMLKANGLARGGCLSNAIVIGESEILNKDGLRFHDEFVRHKVLDVMGDLALLGARVIGTLNAERAGHSLNHRLAHKILKKSSRWDMTETPLRVDYSEQKRDAFLVENLAIA
ncbi:MAG: UDP-3-O-acyl-N-acetylglucosamine deacetylase [Proteobacteria bacterium]|nr:UDP-3-O-acyl-N-acetylglucosamine deacetylase [Pseudomonadota bacterium]